MDNSNKTNITKQKISEVGITKIYLCNFLSEGKLFYSLDQNIDVLKCNIGDKLTAKRFDSYIKAEFSNGELKSLTLVELKTKKTLYKIEGSVLEHFLGLPLFKYETISEQKNKSCGQSVRKRLIANLYKYVVSKAASNF